MAADGGDGHSARYGHEREARRLLPLERQSALRAHGGEPVGGLLEPLFEPPPRPLAAFFEHSPFDLRKCRTHGLIGKR